MLRLDIECPYCHQSMTVVHPGDYSPVYCTCTDCGNRSIVERVLGGTTVYRDGDAPCCSDPDCRALELGLSDD